MYNSDIPQRTELPSSRQILRSTLLASVSALVLLVAVVLPAEYGVDPTGIGQILGLTEMGQTKKQLAAEAATDTGAPVAPISPVTAQAPEATPIMASASTAPPMAAEVVAAAPKMQWRDEMPFVLTPGEGTEIKLVMAQGAKAQYSWVVEGGEVNFDTHADAPGKSISYEKGRGVSSDEGVLTAAFTGNHGWYWRNRGKSNVKVILRTRGDYTAIKK
jgi:hypothetical protein